MSILTVKQVASRYDALTESTIRNWIANEENNGMTICLVRPPEVKRVFIDIIKFEKWIRSSSVKQELWDIPNAAE